MSSPSSIDYAALRLAYSSEPLAEGALAPAPLQQFEGWFSQALAGGVKEPNAMVLSTVNDVGAPSARHVLLKAADSRGFVFFTNQNSRKGRQISANPQVSLVFGWLELYRQICVLGRAEPVPRLEVAEYFATRPWGSRIGAWASHQSEPAADPADLARRFAELSERWPDRGRPDDVPLPEHWGGYLVRAHEIEFWQGRASRLHDRLVYLSTPGAPGAQSSRLDDAGGWRVQRRQP